MTKFKGRSLIDVTDFTFEEILFFLQRSAENKSRILEQSHSLPTRCPGAVALIFFEPSTRTRASFEMAALHVGLKTINLDFSGSSAQKGETIYDTARNIASLGVRGIVMRHSGSGVPYQISKIVDVPIINAGDGFHAHPTQALLDVFTIQSRLGIKHDDPKGLKGLRILIIGDIAHSRVARSNISLMKMFGMKVSVCGPPTLIPPLAQDLGVEVSDHLDKCLESADVVMALRMQVERQNSFQVPSMKEYSKRFGITNERLGKISSKALIFHPGPVNRGVELMSGTFADPRCAVLDQVKNGVFVRATLLELLMGLNQ